MQPPNLQSLQLRLRAYVLAAVFCLSLWPSNTPRHFACAAEVPANLNHDTLSQTIPNTLTNADLPYTGDQDVLGEKSSGYAPDFAYLDRSLIGRQVPEVDKLSNNGKLVKDLDQGTTLHFVLETGQSRLRRAHDVSLEALDAQGTENASGQVARRRETHDGLGREAETVGSDNETRQQQATRRIWITANTCRQARPKGTDVQNHPQLIMYISNSTDNQKPGPDSTDSLVTNTSGILFDSGYATFEFNTTSDLYIGVSAPVLDEEKWFGSWHFEIAASTDGPYHSYDESTPFLYMIDTDSESALFVTEDLGATNASADVDKWRRQNPFVMYAFEAGEWTPISGIEHSYCALVEQFNSNMTKNFTISTNITTKFGDGHLPRSQFHVKGLDTSKTYNGFVVVEENQETSTLPGVGAVRAGGKVFQPFNWTTKADDSCQVLFDLDFCDKVAYAVPSSPDFKLNDTGLGLIYDTQASNYYDNFKKSLAQVACETTGEAQYSLARTCQNCEEDYKAWLCSVLIPRCENWNSDDTWLQPRRINEFLPNGTLPYGGNITAAFNETHRDRLGFNSSRNPLIDTVIKPGPYKEMKPCEDLCFDIVRSCPAQLGFACPNHNSPARDLMYGKKDSSKLDTLTCNFPGAVVKLNVKNAAGVLRGHNGMVGLVGLAMAMLVWV